MALGLSYWSSGILVLLRRLGRGFALLLLALLWFSAGAAETNSFRFAWLSDIHVGSTTGEEDLRATVRDINSSTGLSFVIVSGDITEYGSREQFRLAKEILDQIKIPCHVIAGNHDTKWSESGATDFPRLWGEDHIVFEYGGFRFIGMHQGPIMKMGDGHWSPQDVRWLKETLAAMPDKQQPILFITHYPIDDGIANWFVVLDLLKQYNIQAALCGHIHRNGQATFEGLPGIMARSNLRGNAAIGGYTLAEVSNGAALSVSERIPGMETRPPWHKIVLEQHNFAGETNKFSRPDFSINSKYPGVKEVWRFDSGYTIASSPDLAKGMVIVGDGVGIVHGLDLASGAPRWQFKTGSAVYSTPASSGDLTIFASADGNIDAVKSASGTLAWQYKTQRPIVASPAIAAGVVYIGSSEGKFRALNLATGKLVWEYDGLRGFVETRPLIYQGKVIFGAWDQNLYALDAKTGKVAWKWHGDKTGTMLSPAAFWPIAANDKVFIVAPDRKMTAVSAKTGEQIWRTGDYMVRESIGLSEDQGRFYVRAMQDNFYAFATRGGKPEKIWEINGGFGYDINSAMLIEKDGVVFYGTKNGVLYALDGKTGAIRWEHRLGTGIINTLLPLNGRQVLATDFDGRVFLVDAAGQSARRQ
jgi:outer membrane protein assembly factor BamB/predicted MPP superfamily phosphohydrolase